MVRMFLILAVALVGACAERYKRPIAFVPHGDAVRANMAAQIINPHPPRPHALVTDADHVLLAIEAYDTGLVKDPTAQSTAPDTTSAN